MPETESTDERQGVRDALALLTALIDAERTADAAGGTVADSGPELLYPMILEQWMDGPIRIGATLLALLYMVDGMISAKVGSGSDHDVRQAELQRMAEELTKQGFA
jgi:hypothetical protein